MTPHVERIAELRGKGWSYKRIAKALDRAPGSIAWHCLRYGIEKPGPQRLGHTQCFHGRGFSADEDRRLLALEAEGTPIKRIARLLGRATSSIRGRLMTLARREERAEEAAHG